MIAIVHSKFGYGESADEPTERIDDRLVQNRDWLPMNAIVHSKFGYGEGADEPTERLDYGAPQRRCGNLIHHWP